MIKRTRLAFEDHFTQVPNAWLRDTRLSRRARGLLAELLSHREGWEVTLESLVATGPEGRDAIRSAVGELEECGYLQRQRQRADGGRLAGIDYHLTDPGFPAAENPTVAEALVGESAGKKTITQEDQVLPFGKEEHKVAAQPRRKQSLRTLPTGFAVTADLNEWAQREVPSIDVAWETSKFIDYHTSRETKHRNWEGAWRNWMRNAVEYQKQRGPAQAVTPKAAWHPAQPTDPYAGLSDDELFG